MVRRQRSRADRARAIRAANRTAAALGALSGGIAVAVFGVAPALVGIVVLFAAAAVIAEQKPLRSTPSGARLVRRDLGVPETVGHGERHLALAVERDRKLAKARGAGVSG